MNVFINRYAAAVHSGNLASKPDTVMSDSDVLGAAGFAGKAMRCAENENMRRKGAPLAMALVRMFVGDDPHGRAVVPILMRMLSVEAHRRGDDVTERSANILALTVLDWHRDPTCKVCGGHGYQVVSGTLGERAVIGDKPCRACRGSARRPFGALFARDRLQLALWLRDRVEAETSRAAPEAMAALAPRLTFE